jgi:hypothetical protein
MPRFLGTGAFFHSEPSPGAIENTVGIGDKLSAGLRFLIIRMIRIEHLPNHKTPENSPADAIPQGLLIILLIIFLIIISKIISILLSILLTPPSLPLKTVPSVDNDIENTSEFRIVVNELCPLRS